MGKKAKEAGEHLAAEAQNSAEDCFVSVVDVGGGDDAKVISTAIDAFSKKCNTKAALLLSNSGGKLAFVALVPKALQGKISAKDWAGKLMAATGAKGGGSDARFNGSAADPSLLDKAVAEAKKFG